MNSELKASVESFINLAEYIKDFRDGKVSNKSRDGQIVLDWLQEGNLLLMETPLIKWFKGIVIFESKSSKVPKPSITSPTQPSVYVSTSDNKSTPVLTKSVEEIRDSLRKRIEQQIRADLTIGRTDDELEEYTEEQIIKFISDHESEISETIKQMIDDHLRDNDLHELINPEDDWIREYLYENLSYD